MSNEANTKALALSRKIEEENETEIDLTDLIGYYLSRLPVLSLLFKGGLYLYLILLSLLYTLKTRRRGLVLPLMLLLYGLGLVFGPVSGNSRYFFPILALAPFLCTLSSALPRRQDPSDT